MSVIDRIDTIGEYVNIPVALQVIGVVIFGLTLWVGVHGFGPRFGLIAGALAVYVGKHYAKIYSKT